MSNNTSLVYRHASQQIGHPRVRGIKVTLGLAIIGLLSFPSLSLAVDPIWSVPSGDWSVASNWGGIEPSHSNNAFIQSGVAVISQAGETCNGVFLSSEGGQLGSIQMVSGSLSCSYCTVGNSSPGTFNQSGGTTAVSCDLDVGFFGSGTYNLGDASILTVAMHEYLGRFGDVGLFSQSGGVNQTPYLLIGPSSQYELTRGTLQLTGGLQNNGILNCSNGNGVISVAANSIVNLSGGTILDARNTSLNIGLDSLLIVQSGFDPKSAFGSYSNLGKTHVLGTTLAVAAGEKLQGCADISDFVDCQGSITTFPNQSLNLNGGLFLSGTGQVDLGNGSLMTDGHNSSMTGGTITAYRHIVQGTYLQSGGSSKSGFTLVGGNAGDTAAYYLEGSAYLFSYNAYVGANGNGAFYQTGGTFYVYGDLYLGVSGKCLYEQTGGTLSFGPGGMGLGFHGDSTYNFNGGMLIVHAISSSHEKCVFNFGGGTLQADGSFTIAQPIVLTGIGGNANVDTAGYCIEFSDVLSGAGGLNKLGSGTVTLNIPNSYHGDTFIQKGTLAIAATGSVDSSPVIHISTGAVLDVSGKSAFVVGGAQRLTGGGRLLGSITAATASHIAPGDSVGILTIEGDLTLNSGAFMDFELDKTSASDRISMSSSRLNIDRLDLTNFNFTTLSGYGPGTYTLIDAATISGTLGPNLTGTLGGRPVALFTSGNDLLLAVSVPEPSTLMSCGIACLVALTYSRRRRNRAQGQTYLLAPSVRTAHPQ